MKRREEKRREEKRREEEGKNEREQERERRENPCVSVQNASVCTVRTSPCAPGNRPACRRPPGFHTTTRELQTCTFKGPGLQKHHQNSTRRPQRERKRAKMGAGEGKKSAKFWAVQRRGVRRRVVQGGGPGAGGPAQGVSGGGNEKKSKKPKHLENN